MGDLKARYQVHRKTKQERHARMHNANRKEIADSEYTYIDRGESFLFRDFGCPRVDFYPSTGRWRDLDGKKTYRGGAVTFLKWYSKLQCKSR